MHITKYLISLCVHNGEVSFVTRTWDLSCDSLFV